MIINICVEQKTTALLLKQIEILVLKNLYFSVHGFVPIQLNANFTLPKTIQRHKL